jgi:hypothetical protein
MTTEEIPASEWPEFLDSFSGQHHKWLVTIEVLSPTRGDQLDAIDAPLEEISADTEHGRVLIQTASEPESHETHVVEAASRMHVMRTPEGADDTLEIESADGAKTLLRFRSVIPAEMVDGMI